jgi:hypothetical protein
LVMVFCMRASNSLVTLHETEIAFQLRVSDDELKETKRLFVSKGFIDESWNVLNWDKRQFRSDSSAERVSRHREKKRKESNGDVTLQKQRSNAPEQNRTEQITTSSADELFNKFWQAYPRHTAKQNARKAWDKLKLVPDDPRLQAIEIGLLRAKQSRDWLKDSGQFIPHAATWLNGARWNDDYSVGVVVPLERRVAL